MTQLDIEISALRSRRRNPGFSAWLRRRRPFDRRAIRDPRERDAYWAVVQRRLAESDAVSLMNRATERPTRADLRLGPSVLIGAD